MAVTLTMLPTIQQQWQQTKNQTIPQPTIIQTETRVSHLDSINFAWTVMPVRVTWEQRLEEPQQF